LDPSITYRFFRLSVKIKSSELISSLLNIDDGLPDCTENPFGAHNDLIRMHFLAKRLKGKAGTKAGVRN
jgi:hypothetical protein